MSLLSLLATDATGLLLAAAALVSALAAALLPGERGPGASPRRELAAIALAGLAAILAALAPTPAWLWLGAAAALAAIEPLAGVDATGVRRDPGPRFGLWAAAALGAALAGTLLLGDLRFGATSPPSGQALLGGLPAALLAGGYGSLAGLAPLNGWVRGHALGRSPRVTAALLGLTAQVGLTALVRLVPPTAAGTSDHTLVALGALSILWAGGALLLERGDAALITAATAIGGGILLAGAALPAPPTTALLLLALGLAATRPLAAAALALDPHPAGDAEATPAPAGAGLACLARLGAGGAPPSATFAGQALVLAAALAAGQPGTAAAVAGGMAALLAVSASRALAPDPAAPPAGASTPATRGVLVGLALLAALAGLWVVAP